MNPKDALALLMEELDAETVGELIDQYLADTPVQIATMRAAAQSGDLATFGRTAHSVAGSSATFGLGELRATCLALEEAALAGAVDQFAAGIESVARGYEEAVPVLRRISGRP
jgi:HPt (histidine-containing phosphotransfer) domain-containing protein